MIPEAELARALARWKARKLGTAPPPQYDEGAEIDAEAHVEASMEASTEASMEAASTGEPAPEQGFEEATRVAEMQYPSQVKTPPAGVHLADDDLDDRVRRR